MSKVRNRTQSILVVILIGLIPMFLLIGWLLSLKFQPELEATEIDNLIEEYKKDSQNQEQSEPKETQKDLLIIPKLGIVENILSGDSDVLEKGIWHRSPGVADPILGGNFVLSGHRFTMGLNASGLWNSSPLFNIDRLNVDDEILIAWRGDIYKYTVSNIFSVTPDKVEIEDASNDSILTLYTCTLKGAADGRYVIQAEPIAD